MPAAPVALLLGQVLVLDLATGAAVAVELAGVREAHRLRTAFAARDRVGACFDRLFDIAALILARICPQRVGIALGRIVRQRLDRVVMPIGLAG